MCIKAIHKFFPLDDKTEGVGYKVFEHALFNGGYIGPFYGPRYAIGVTYERDIVPIMGDTVEYNSGFHVFPNFISACEYYSLIFRLVTNEPDACICKVKYTGIVCKGYEMIDYCAHTCLVVKQMQIIEEVKEHGKTEEIEQG